jgi:hypothetical protein
LARSASFLYESVSSGLSLALGGVAALRRGKAVHPKGVVHEATLSIAGSAAAPAGVDFLQRAAEHPAIVRFSRSIGLPRPLPDLLGMSLRVPHAHGPDRHQDFLLITSADLPVLHHVFLPATEVDQRPYSSSLPFRADDGLYLIGALPTSPKRFDFAVSSLGGRFKPVGQLQVGRRLPDELDATCFNPWNTGGGVWPAGSLNRMRDRSYRSSQRAWLSRQRSG